MNRFDYDDTDIHLRYGESRRLGPEVLKGWMDAVERNLPEGGVRALLDLGCGTGRFTASLRRRFDAAVYGVDPSAGMLGTAREVVGEEAELLRGSAEAIPLPDSCVEVVFMSMVIHHIADREAACREIRRVLAPGGRLMIRMVTSERLRSFPWTRFFPAALAVDERRIPSHNDLVDLMEGNGFGLVRRETVVQRFAEDPEDYYRKIAMRGMSSLHELTDREFEEGLRGFREHCLNDLGGSNGAPVTEEIDLFVFRPLP